MLDLSTWHQLHPRWITLQRIGGLMTLLFIGAPTIAGAVVLTFTSMLSGYWRLTPGIAWIMLMILLVWTGLIFPPIAYRHIRYKITDLGIEIRQGVFWKHVINVPRSRVQHTDVRQGPLQRRYRVASLVMHTAGTTNHTVVLGGLPHDRALSIRDFLLHEAEQQREVNASPATEVDHEPESESAAASENAYMGSTAQADDIMPERRGDDA